MPENTIVTIGGQAFTTDDLMEDGERINPQAILDGLMIEIAVTHNNEIRHIALFTPKGQQIIGTTIMAAAERGEL